MSTLINIAKDDSKPVLIDATELTCIKFHESEGKPAVSFYNGEGRTLWVGLDDWNLDAADLIKKLRDGGVPLVSFPQRWEKNDDTFGELERFINPAAVTFATVTEVREEGHLGSVIGVKGLGREDSYNNTPEELAELIAAVRAIKPLLEYKPEEANARWYNPAALYIDPKSVTRINDGGWGQIDVFFAQTGSLDIKIKKTEVNDIVNDMPGFTLLEGKSLTEIFNEARRRAEALDKAARFKFSNELAAANGNLIAVPSDTVASHVDPQNINFMYLTDIDYKTTRLVVEMKKTTDNPYQNDVSIDFGTHKEARNALAAIAAAVNKTSPGASPRNNPPTP